MRPPKELRAVARTARERPAVGAAPRLCLLVLGEGFFGTHSLPARGDCLIGRAPGCNLQIDEPWISRQHAVVHLGAACTIADLGSANGTRVNGTLLAPNVPLTIGAGAMIELGSTVLVAQYRAANAPPERRVDTVETVLDPAMARLHQLVPRLAQGTISVLVLGETGVGKEVMAERIHQLSPRRDRPLLRLNCAALAETLLESELFGHERGAFTGAAREKPGLLETADGGTVFLDEIGDLSPTLQAKLLRVLEERSVLRVGGLRARPIDVRFVAATHRDLAAEVQAGRFRQDLFFRLSGVTLVVPPLRERRAEIGGLARGFVTEACRALGRAPAPELTPAAVELLREHPWPGNVRELRHAVERAVLLAAGPTLTPEQFTALSAPAARPTTAPLPAAPDAGTLPDRRSDYERRLIVEALDRCHGNQTLAARELGIPRRTLIRRIESYALARPRKR